MEKQLIACLNELVDKDEYFEDYLCITSPFISNEDDVYKKQQQLAEKGFEYAASAYKAQDLPFYPPDNFESSKYRNEKLMQRISYLEQKKEQEIQKREEKRRAALDRKNQSKNKGKTERARKQDEKLQKEVIEKWKAAREIAKKNGGNEEQIKMEDIQQEILKDRHLKRVRKDKKYGHKKISKKNDGRSANNDTYVHREFERK